MTMILTKIQYTRTGTADLESGEVPYYEKNGKFFLKSNDQEIIITDEEEIVL